MKKNGSRNATTQRSQRRAKNVKDVMVDVNKLLTRDTEARGALAEFGVSLALTAVRASPNEVWGVAEAIARPAFQRELERAFKK